MQIQDTIIRKREISPALINTVRITAFRGFGCSMDMINPPDIQPKDVAIMPTIPENKCFILKLEMQENNERSKIHLRIIINTVIIIVNLYRIYSKWINIPVYLVASEADK